MADISDVEQVLVNMVSAILYPNAVAQASALPGGAIVEVSRGWPIPDKLDGDLAAKISNVTVWPRGGIEHNTTRYPVDFQEVSRSAPTLTAVVNANTITIGGTNDKTIRQFITIQVGPRIVVSYDPANSDTTDTIAIQLAAMITANGFIATSFQSVITVQSGVSLRSIIGVDAVQVAEVRRQETMVQISLWCPTPDVRDAIAKLIEPVLSTTTFLTMPDQTAARLRYHMTVVTDAVEKSNLFRRDLIYCVEYATTINDTATEVTVVNMNTTSSDGAGGLGPTIPSNYILPPRPAHADATNTSPPFQPHVPN